MLESDNWIEAFVKYTDNTEPTESYRRWVAISTVASALQRKCRLIWGSETFYPNMFIVLVGPPAARKGTAMKPGKVLLDSLGIAVSADESSRQKLIKTLQECAVADQRADLTIDFHSSLTIYSTELTVFLGFESRDLLALLCKWYDCENRFVYDTHARGKEEIQNVWTNLIGATTPQQLQAALPSGAVGSGFTSRVVFVFEPNKGKLVFKPTLEESMEEELTNDLDRMRSMSGDFEVTEETEQFYFNWYQESENKRLFTDPRLEYYVQRRPTHLFKLCIIHSAARGSDLMITPKDLLSSINVLEEAEKTMPKVFEGVGENTLATVQTRLLSLLQEKGEVPMSEIARTFADDVSFSQLGEVIAGLEQMKFAVFNMTDPKNLKLTYKGK